MRRTDEITTKQKLEEDTITEINNAVTWEERDGKSNVRNAKQRG